MRNNKKMKNNKKYMLIGVGGMNGEIWNLVGKYDSLEEVFKRGDLDDNEELFEKSYNEKYWDGYYGDMEDSLDEYLDKNEEVNGKCYLINESLEMFEVKVYN